MTQPISTQIPLVDVQREVYAIEATYELGLAPPIPHPFLVELLDAQGAWVGEIQVVSALAATAITRAANKAGWGTRTGGAR